MEYLHEDFVSVSKSSRNLNGSNAEASLAADLRICQGSLPKHPLVTPLIFHRRAKGSETRGLCKLILLALFIFGFSLVQLGPAGQRSCATERNTQRKKWALKSEPELSHLLGRDFGALQESVQRGVVRCFDPSSVPDSHGVQVQVTGI